MQNESNFRKGQTQGLKKHLKMPPGERQKTGPVLSLFLSCKSFNIYETTKGFLKEYIQPAKKMYKTSSPQFSKCYV